MVHVRRLGPGDAPVLAMLAKDDADFDLDGRGGGRTPLTAGDAAAYLADEIGVRRAWRRQGTGRALVGAMDGWMVANGVTKVWVLADNPEAERFYAACGFARDSAQPVQMSARRP